MMIVITDMQATFDKIVLHLMEQNRQAFDETSNHCQYLTESGRRCAVGCLIPREEYRHEMENQSVDDLVNQGFMTINDGSMITMMMKMQSMHDGWNCCYDGTSFRRYILNRSREIAADFSLTMPDLSDYNV